MKTVWSELTEKVQFIVLTRKRPKKLIITGVREAVEQNPVLPTGIGFGHHIQCPSFAFIQKVRGGMEHVWNLLSGKIIFFVKIKCDPELGFQLSICMFSFEEIRTALF